MRISDWSSDVCSSDLSDGNRPSQIAKCRTQFLRYLTELLKPLRRLVLFDHERRTISLPCPDRDHTKDGGPSTGPFDCQLRLAMGEHRAQPFLVPKFRQQARDTLSLHGDRKSTRLNSRH